MLILPRSGEMELVFDQREGERERELSGGRRRSVEIVTNLVTG